MAGFRYKSGGGTVTIGPELERILDQIENGALKAVRGELARVTDTVATDGSAGWYKSGIKRRTGKSGKWESGVEINGTTMSGYVESGDDRTTKKGIPPAFFVHRPGASSTVERKVDDAEYKQVVAAYRATGSLPTGYDALIDKSGKPINVRKIEKNPAASDGKTLMPELITRPMKAAAKELAKTLGPEIKKLATKGR